MKELYQVEYKDDCNKKHICFVPKTTISFYKTRFQVTDVFKTKLKFNAGCSSGSQPAS